MSKDEIANLKVGDKVEVLVVGKGWHLCTVEEEQRCQIALRSNVDSRLHWYDITEYVAIRRPSTSTEATLEEAVAAVRKELAAVNNELRGALSRLDLEVKVAEVNRMERDAARAAQSATAKELEAVRGELAKARSESAIAKFNLAEANDVIRSLRQRDVNEPLICHGYTYSGVDNDKKTITLRCGRPGVRDPYGRYPSDAEYEFTLHLDRNLEHLFSDLGKGEKVRQLEAKLDDMAKRYADVMSAQLEEITDLKGRLEAVREVVG